MRNIVNDSTVWAKVRRLGLLVSLVFAMATTALGQELQNTNHQQQTDSVRVFLLIDTTKNHALPYFKWFVDSDTTVLSNHVACDKAIADTSFITKKEIVLYIVLII